MSAAAPTALMKVCQNIKEFQSRSGVAARAGGGGQSLIGEVTYMGG